MTKSEVDGALYKGLCQVLVPEGFIAVAADQSFKRPTSFGFQELIHAVYGGARGVAFSFSVAIRFDAIQDVVGPYSGISPETRGDAFTLHVRPTYFVGDDLKIEVCTPDDVATALVTFEAFFHEHLSAFFDKCNTIEAAEQLLNHDPNYQFTGNLVHKAVCGVVAAALCRRSDFPEIIGRYRQELSGYIEPARKQFEAAVAYATANLLPN